MLPTLEPIIQKTLTDCGLAALAMVLGRPYRDLSEMAAAICPRVRTSGIYMTDIARLAAAFGAKFKREKTLMDGVTGLLVVVRGRGQKRQAHITALFQGVVVDPTDGLLWDYDTYLAQGWTVTAVLERVR